MAKHPGILTDLTPVELRLIDAARRGEVLVCSDLDHDQLRDAADPALLIRGQVIRELLLGRHDELDPRGVQVGGACITGEIALQHIAADQGLGLYKCAVEQPVNLRYAQLPWLDLTDTGLPALDAEGLRIDGDMFLKRLVASSANGMAVNVLGAHIGGSLNMEGARLANITGPALNAERLKVDGSVILSNKLIATGQGDVGAVSLGGAYVGGELDLSGARLTNTTGPALHANGMKVELQVVLGEGFSADGHSELGAVSLIGADLGVQFDLVGAELANSGGVLLNLQDARSHLMFLPLSLICPQHRTSGRTCPDGSRRFDVDGFVYTEVDGIHSEWQRWLHLLRCHTANYTPMPYQQLAAIRTAAGHDRDARRILIAQQQDHRIRGNIGGPLQRVSHALWGALAGYGYRTGRTALALLIVLLLAGGMGWWAGHTETAPGRHAAEHPTKFTACSPVELIGMGIDRGLPLASTGIRARCDLDTSSNAGQWFTVAIWLLQAAVWALATLALAGYTGLVRKIR